MIFTGHMETTVAQQTTNQEKEKKKKKQEQMHTLNAIDAHSHSVHCACWWLFAARCLRLSKVCIYIYAEEKTNAHFFIICAHFEEKN